MYFSVGLVQVLTVNLTNDYYSVHKKTFKKKTLQINIAIVKNEMLIIYNG